MCSLYTYTTYRVKYQWMCWMFLFMKYECGYAAYDKVFRRKLWRNMSDLDYSKKLIDLPCKNDVHPYL